MVGGAGTSGFKWKTAMNGLNRWLNNLEHRFGIARDAPPYLVVMIDGELGPVEDAYIQILLNVVSLRQASSASSISKESPVTKRNGLCARTKPKAPSATNREKVGREHRLFTSSWNKRSGRHDSEASPEIGARSESKRSRHVPKNSVRRLRRYENQRRR